MFELDWGTVVQSDSSDLSRTFPCHSTSAAIYLCHSTSAPAYLCYTQPWKLAQTAWPHFTCLQELWNVIYWCNKHSIALVHIATWPHGGLKTSSYLYMEIAEPTVACHPPPFEDVSSCFCSVYIHYRSWVSLRPIPLNDGYQRLSHSIIHCLSSWQYSVPQVVRCCKTRMPHSNWI